MCLPSLLPVCVNYTIFKIYFSVSLILRVKITYNVYSDLTIRLQLQKDLDYKTNCESEIFCHTFYVSHTFKFCLDISLDVSDV